MRIILISMSFVQVAFSYVSFVQHAGTAPRPVQAGRALAPPAQRTRPSFQAVSSLS